MPNYSAVRVLAVSIFLLNAWPAWSSGSSDRPWAGDRGGDPAAVEDLDDLSALEDDSEKKDEKVKAAELRVARLFLKAYDPTSTPEERAEARAQLFTARRGLAKLQIAAAQAREALLARELKTPGLSAERQEVLGRQRVEAQAAAAFHEARIETIGVREKLSDPDLTPEARKRLNEKLAANLNTQFEARKKHMAADIAAIDAELADPATSSARRAELEKRKAGDQLVFTANDKRQEVLEISARLKSPGMSEADKKALRAELKQAKREALQASINAIKHRLGNDNLTAAARKMLQAQLENLRERKADLGPGKKKKAGEHDGPVVNATIPEVGGGRAVGQ